jgi:hypothetical protein
MTHRNKMIIFALGCTANALFCSAVYYGISAHSWPVYIRVWAFMAILPATYLSGKFAGFVSATFHALLCYLIFSDPWQIFTTALVGYVATTALGYAQERRWVLKDEAERNEQARDFVDNINGNLKSLSYAVETLDRFIASIPYLEKEALALEAKLVRGHLADLLTATRGWYHLALAKGFVMEENYEDNRETK